MATSIFEQRFSCRAFSPEAIPDNRLSDLLRVATLAPNAGNLQPWHFVVVRDPVRRTALAAAAGNQMFVGQAPCVVVVCAVPERSARVYGQRGRELYCLQDTAAAVQNLLLAATDAGLAGCWVGAFDEEAVCAAVDLEPGQRPIALVPLGRAAESPPRRTRLPLDRVVTWI